MGNITDVQLGLKKESTYGTAVTVDRFYPVLSGTKAQWDTRVRHGEGMFVGSQRAERGNRSVVPTGRGEVTVKTELASKTCGVLLEALFGVAASTVVEDSTYQQLFHPGISGTVLPSYTIQLGKPRNDGTIDPETYAGCTAKAGVIECPEDGPITVEVVFDAKSLATGTSLASASYTSGAYLFDHSQGAGGFGGTLSVPTTTALASGLNSFADFRSWKLEIDQGLDIDRWVIGGRNQPIAQKLGVKFGGKIEYNSTTFRSVFLGGTSTPVYVTHTTTEALSTGYSQLQVTVPQWWPESPGLPDPDGGTVVQDVTGTARYDGTNRVVYAAVRTADTAL